MLEAALVAGLCAEGADVVLVGRAPHARRRARSPVERGAPAAVISASHNPFGDNGVKLFAAGGRKIPESLELQVEQELRTLAVTAARTRARGRRRRRVERAPQRARRLRGRRSSTRCRAGSSSSLHVVVDCGNGAAFRAAPTALRALGADRRRDPRVARRREHQRRLRLHAPRRPPGGGAAGPRRRRARVRRRRRPGDRGRRARRRSSTATRSLRSPPSTCTTASCCAATRSSPPSCRTSGCAGRSSRTASR